MTVDPFTYEEHQARAMLVGRKYLSSGGYYFSDDVNGSRLDAVTLVPLTMDEANARITAAMDKPTRKYYD